jgi:hypothetical protein
MSPRDRFVRLTDNQHLSSARCGERCLVWTSSSKITALGGRNDWAPESRRAWEG